MRGSALTTLAVLSVPFFLLAQADGRSAGKSQATEDLDGSLRARKIPHPLNDDSGRTERRRQPCTGLWKVARVAGASGGICSKAQPEKKADSKRQAPRLLPLKSKTQGLQNHLKGHGKFNMDMYSCPGIQSKTCKKPSDCAGCLGLYTCKLPKGKCDLKAVSRKTGGFSQSIQHK